MADIRIAILDDYQGIALGLADWSSLPAGTDVQSFAMPARDEHDLVQRLQPYDVIVAMRERTPFPAAVIDALPNLRLLVSTGLRNAASILTRAAPRHRGVQRPGARTGLDATAEAAWALTLALHKRVVQSHNALCDGAWQTVITASLRTAWSAWPAWATWAVAWQGGSCLRHGGDRVESQPHSERAASGGVRPGLSKSCSRKLTSCRCTWCWAPPPQASSRPSGSPA